MLVLQFNNLKNLNVSLQVGDGVYGRVTETQSGADDKQASYDHNNPTNPLHYNNLSTGANHYIGILRKIDYNGDDQYDLYVDETAPGANYTPQENDFIMFSKFTQGDSGVLGYYAEAKFVNDSLEKAELFTVSSEVIINSN